MAYVCYDCRIIFSSKKVNCPFCGGRIYLDEKSDLILTNEGFTISDIEARIQNTTTSLSDDFHIDDSDTLSILRQAYDKEHRHIEHNIDGTSTHNVAKNNHHQTSQGSNNTVLQTDTSSIEVNQTTEDFFSNLQTSSTSTTSIPTVGNTFENSTPFPFPVVNNIDSELQSIERQRQRINNIRRRNDIINFFSNIDLGIVFRIIFVLILVIVILTIWSLRYVIIDSILNFLIALIPPLLFIWIIVSIIKSFFK
jgi:hypothetical protein